jgi:hypothetical protein
MFIGQDRRPAADMKDRGGPPAISVLEVQAQGELHQSRPAGDRGDATKVSAIDVRLRVIKVYRIEYSHPLYLNASAL